MKPRATHASDPADRALLRLCSLVRPVGELRPGLAALGRDDWERLARNAIHHGLGGLASRNLDRIAEAGSAGTAARERLAANRRQVLAQNLARRSAARALAEALDAASIPYVVLKGVALAEEVYGDLSLRAFNDFDVMVPLEAVDEACAIARSQEYGFIRPGSARDWMRAGRHALGMSRRADGASVDIHWTIGPELSRDSPRIAWAHAVAAPAHATLPGLRLSPELSLVHLAKHFHTSQYGLLKPLVDFHATACAAGTLDGGRVRELARSLGVSGVLAVTTAIAERAFGTAYAGLAGPAGPSAWARAAAALVPDGVVVEATSRSRLANWSRYLAASGGPGFTARGVARELFPGPLALAQFFNAPFRPRMYPAYYWRQVVKVLTLSSK